MVRIIIEVWPEYNREPAGSYIFQDDFLFTPTVSYVFNGFGLSFGRNHSTEFLEPPKRKRNANTFKRKQYFERKS